MKQSEKFSIASGVVLLSVAAIFIISLMLHFLDFGVAMPYFFEKCANFGTMLFSVYGISSFLIPVFLFVASIFLFMPTWDVKRGLYLAFSLVPFFTIVGIEKFCNNIFVGDSLTLLLLKYSTLILVSALVVVIEYLIVGIIADSVIAKKIARQNQIKVASQLASVEKLEDENLILDEEIDEELSLSLADDSENIETLESGSVETSKNPTEEKPEIIENPDDISPAPENFNPELEYGNLHSPYIDIPNLPEEIEEEIIPNTEDLEQPTEEDLTTDIEAENQIEVTDKRRITPEEIDALLADDYQDEPEVIQMDFNTENKPEMIILPQEEIQNPNETQDFSANEDIEETSNIEEDFSPEETETKSGLLAKAMKIREEALNQEEKSTTFSDENIELSTEEEINPSLDLDVLDSTNDFQNAGEVSSLDPDEEFDRLVFGEDEELKKKFVSEDEQNFLNNPFGENPNNPFDFLGEAGKDIQIEEDEFLEGSDEIGAFEFNMEEENSQDEEIPEENIQLNSNIEDFEFSENFEDSEELDENDEIENIADFDEDSEDDLDLDELDDSEDLEENEEILLDTSNQVKKNYNIPIEGVLASYQNNPYWIIDEETKQAGQILKETLSEFKIEAEVTGIRKGPVVTMFEILPAPGVKLNRIVALQDNIALRLAAQSVRIVAPIPGKHAVGIEVPNKERAVVSFREIIEKDLPQFEKMKIPVVLGKDISGDAQLLDLATTPHLLIAGSTGSGKSVCVNSMILSILYKRSPKDVKMILIDPKIVELKLYNDIPHLLTPVITEPKKAFQALQYCLCEMERRYAMLDHMGVRDISTYNKRIKERQICQEKMPYIVVVIDEFADLMATTGKELETTVARLAAMSRAVGIHLVLATQRPSIDVITGLIKANIPTRIAFMVASKTDSRIIIDQVGSEKLLGKGDMLYASAIDPFPVRIQGTFVTEDEVEKVVDCVKSYGEPEYIDEEIFVEDDEEEGAEPGLFTEGSDPLYDRALEIVVQAGKASASYIQRRLKIGYNRAARLVEEMEARGIVGPANGSKPREIIHIP